MLTGVFRHSIDSKKRLFIPARHREVLGPSFMVVKDIRAPRLKVYSQEAWDRYLDSIRQLDWDVAEQVMRFLHRDAVNAEPDSQGRILLTSELLDYAGIEKDCVVVGCYDYAEIWSETAYDDMISAENVDALRAKITSLGKPSVK